MSDNVIGAFSEEQAERLTGVSRAQLRRWAGTGFFRASYEGSGNRAFSRIYSFRDIVSLRVLNELRNVHNVSMPELRKAAQNLSHLGDDLWVNARLWVHRGKVVYEEPKTSERYEVTTRQSLFKELPLRVKIKDTRKAIADMNRRPAAQIGQITRTKYVNNMAPVIAGTRIPVRVIKEYADAGYSEDQILKEYPSLTAADVRAAIAYDQGVAAT